MIDLARFRSTCRSCGAPIVWTTTPTGKRMPIDFAVDRVHGNVRVDGGVDGRPHSEVLHGIDIHAAHFDDEPLHTSHFVTCPDADDWRRP